MEVNTKRQIIINIIEKIGIIASWPTTWLFFYQPKKKDLIKEDANNR